MRENYRSNQNNQFSIHLMSKKENYGFFPSVESDFRRRGECRNHSSNLPVLDQKKEILDALRAQDGSQVLNQVVTIPAIHS